MENGCGLVEGLSIERYHALDPVSKSQLDTLDLSPAIFYARHRASNRPAPVSKAGQLEGQLAHCAVLEPHEFEARYVVGPTVNRNTKVWKEFVEAHPDRVAIQGDQYEAAVRQAASVRALPEVREALERGRAEVSAFWTDPDTGVECRCRPDFVHPVNDSAVVLLDLKTFSSAAPDEFRRQAARKRYHIQDAFYTDGYAAASDLDVLAFIFIAVETEYPYAASAMMLDGVSRDQGRADYKRNLTTYKRCEESGDWPGYSKEIQLITLPNWAFQE
ncbi:PD-(D/E)XK nuclease-like domain-containing protein [Paraburkholderia metrosideri]|uniref:PD-(D/E)XK nuclease-like domain-containing protein n=1 Tax=Paraburkholderia metrosideri TaxID=580937 RepID=A0ABW9DVH2_9BURK